MDSTLFFVGAVTGTNTSTPLSPIGINTTETDKDAEIARLTAENARLKEEKTCKNISENNPVDEFKCSKCGFMAEDFHRLVIDEDDGEHINYEYEIKYCPNCGAKVEDEE